MPRPLTRAQQLENRAFLRQLRKTGNATVAARALGFGRGRFNERRAKHSAFAAQWDAALVLAHAALTDARVGTVVPPPGEPYIRRSNTGRWQVRRSQAGLIDHDARQRFLAALSASANVALSAAAAGFRADAFYRHRQRNPGFAREWKLALAMGYERLEMALLESANPESFADDDWRRNDPPAMPPMTVNQGLQLLYLHQKEVRLGGEHPELSARLHRGESWQARVTRLGLMREQRLARDRERFRIAEAEALARGEPTYIDWEAEGNPLPDLSQVTGWSKAKGKLPTDPDRALFGGWRIKDIPAGKRRR